MKLLKSALSFSLLLSVILFQGCTAFRTTVKDVDVERPKHIDAEYDYTDLKQLSAELTNELINSDFLNQQKTPPVFVIYGIEPRTTIFVDTKALTNKIRTLLMKSRKVQFVNQSRRDELLTEQDYQQQHSLSTVHVEIGKQLGAKYMLTGSLIEMKKKSGRQIRISKKELIYYNLTIEITDLETGLIAYISEKEFVREASKPIFGW